MRKLCFNSQPPEGGWKNAYVTTGRTISFNSQPPEGCWGCSLGCAMLARLVSTHSRPKAAGKGWRIKIWLEDVSTHSRPKAAGSAAAAHGSSMAVSTHSRPKAAGFILFIQLCFRRKFQLTAARRRLALGLSFVSYVGLFQLTAARRRLAHLHHRFQESLMFQLTAARRRLDPSRQPSARSFRVSTHSRPKAAGVPVIK